MRITIRRVKDALAASMVEGPNGENIPVDRLLAGLRELTLRLLAQLIGTETVLIYDNPEETLFERAGDYATLPALESISDDAFRARMLEVVTLLQWHFSPRWIQANPDDDHELTCASCRQTHTHDPNSFCRNRFCDSHKKLQAIIGPAYSPPPAGHPVGWNAS